MNHSAVYQKLTQHCISTILQYKNFKKEINIPAAKRNQATGQSLKH